MKKKIPAQRQRNSNARTQRKSKLLRLKNFFKRVMDKRYEKVLKARKPKGITLVGQAAKQIKAITRYQRSYYVKGSNLNQRQKRKRIRHAPHMRKKLSQ